MYVILGINKVKVVDMGFGVFLFGLVIVEIVGFGVVIFFLDLDILYLLLE